MQHSRGQTVETSWELVDSQAYRASLRVTLICVAHFEGRISWAGNVIKRSDLQLDQTIAVTALLLGQYSLSFQDYCDVTLDLVVSGQSMTLTLSLWLNVMTFAY